MYEKITFSDFMKHPLMKVQSLDGVLTYFPAAVNSSILGSVLPLKNYNAERVVMDLDKAARGGMMPMVARGSESPVVDIKYGRGREEFDAIEYRGKTQLFEEELVDFRKLGTLDTNIRASELLRRKYFRLEEMLANSIEWARRSVLFDRQVTGRLPDGLEQTINYNHPDYLEPVASTKWDQGSATPVDDLMLWADEYLRYSGFAIDRIIVPHGTFRLLMKNTRFLDIAKNSFAAFNGSKEQIKRLITDFTGIANIEESSDRIHFTREVMADVANGASTITLDSVDFLKTGDKIVLKSISDRDGEMVEVGSINASTRVVTLTAAIQKTAGFKAGSLAGYHRLTIPENKILIVGRLGAQLDPNVGAGLPDMDKLSQWGEVASTLSHFTDFDRPKPGVFRKTINWMDKGDPPHIDQILGIRALPRIHYYEGWMTGQILT